MSIFQTLSDITNEIAKKFGDSKLVQLKNGSVLLQFEQLGILLANYSDSSKFYIVTFLGTLPELESDRLALCEKLLKANAFFLATCGYTLSVTEGFGITLQGKIPYADLREEGDALRLLENFLDVANYWKEHCNLENFNDREKSVDDPLFLYLNAGLRV